MARWSISRRLIAILSGGLVALWLLAVGVSALVLRHEINEVFDSSLQETAQRLLPLAIDDLRGNQEEEDRAITESVEIAVHDEYLTYQVRDASGRVLLRSHDAQTTPFPAPLKTGYTEIKGRRFYTEAAITGDLFLQIAEPLAYRTAAVVDNLLWLAAPLLLLVPLAGLTIFWTVRGTMRPIASVREALRQRSGANLAPIDESALPEELAPIIHDVNRLLERLAHALEAERNFAANSAHELRTPVAAALAQAQRLTAELGSGPQRERAVQIAASLRRLGEMGEKLLQLSRAEAGIARDHEPADLMPALRLVVDEFARIASNNGRIVFDDGGRDRLVAPTDIDAFGIALRNLIDNALVHGADDQPVTIHVDKDGAVHVVNGGRVVPHATLETLTHRFARGGATGRGSGLGLAITDTIMRQSGGRLELRSPATGRDDGFEAVLRFAAA